MYSYWISWYKLCIVIGFPWINSAAQLSFVGYSFLVLENISMFVLLILLNEKIPERRQNLVSAKHSKTGIILHMPNVHPTYAHCASCAFADVAHSIIRRLGRVNHSSFSSCSMFITLYIVYCSVHCTLFTAVYTVQYMIW